MLAFRRPDCGAVQFWGQWQEAEETLEASGEDFSRSRPSDGGQPLAGLAELGRRQARPRTRRCNGSTPALDFRGC